MKEVSLGLVFILKEMFTLVEIVILVLTIIAQSLLRGRIPCVVDRVHSITTPGEVVDALVTEFGVTINPRRQDLIDACKEAKGEHTVPLIPIDELAARAHQMSGPMEPVAQGDRIIGVIEWRDGTVIDVVRELAK